MSLVDSAFEDIGTVMGFESGEFDGLSHVALEIEGVGELHAEHQAEAVIIYLLRVIEVGTDKLDYYKYALRLIHIENGLPYRFQCGLYSERLVFLVRLDNDELGRQSIEQVIELLIGLHEKMASL